MAKLKLALVGAGRRSAAHLPVIAALDDLFDLVGVADVVVEAASAAAAPYGVPAYERLERLLADAKPDVVDLTVPVDAHHVIAASVAAHGAHMLVETPLACSLPCADFMIAAARRERVHLEAAENVWRFPEERMKRAVLDSGILGDPLRGYVVFSAGGCHAMNALRAYVGFDTPAVEAWCRTSRWPVASVIDAGGRPLTEEAWRFGLIRFDTGKTGLYEWASTCSSPLRSHVPHYYRVDAERGALVNAEVYCLDQGRARLHMMEKLTRDERGIRVLEQIRIATDPAVAWENPLRQYRLTAGHLAVASALVGLHRAIVEGGEPEYGAANARADLELSIALEESARLDQPVRLPVRDLTGHEQERHARYLELHGHEPLEVEALLQHPFPRA